MITKQGVFVFSECLVNLFPIGSSLTGLNVLNGTLTFFADDGVNGFELWISDGTGDGTILIDICPGPCNSQT